MWSCIRYQLFDMNIIFSCNPLVKDLVSLLLPFLLARFLAFPSYHQGSTPLAVFCSSSSLPRAAIALALTHLVQHGTVWCSLTMCSALKIAPRVPLMPSICTGIGNAVLALYPTGSSTFKCFCTTTFLRTLRVVALSS